MRMSFLHVSVLLSMALVAYAGQWDLPAQCPEDNSLCELAIPEGVKNQCYLHSISDICCNRCKSLRDNSRADTCPYGDYSEHISTANGNLVTCALIKTEKNCEPCKAPRLGRQNCCQTCEEVCGPEVNKRNQSKRLSDLIRELKSLIEK